MIYGLSGVKFTEEIRMHKEKILVICKSASFQNFSTDNYEIIFQSFPNNWHKHKRANNYSIIILDYDVFYDHPKEQEIFEKELFEALDNAATVCFLHYDETIPNHDEYNCTAPYFNRKHVNHLKQHQIGLKFLLMVNIAPHKITELIHPKLKTEEFKNYGDKWACSKLYFKEFEALDIDEIFTRDKYYLGFSTSFKKGDLIFLPAQKDHSKQKDVEELYSTLTDSLITYKTKKRIDIPDWANCPLFEEEKGIQEKHKEQSIELLKLKKELDKYKDVKNLAFLSEYTFEKQLPLFLKNNFNIDFEQEETFNEDFWILDEKKEKAVICECKTYVKGFKKSGIYNLHNHRENNQLDDNFPAILFVSSNLNATSWKTKNLPIMPNDIATAFSNNILIVKIEDILNLWCAFQNNKITTNEILDLFKNKKGWLKVSADGTFVIKHK